MSNKDMDLEDIVLSKANIHHGDINKDIKFDCENNCPYCNDQVICIKPIEIHLQDYNDDMEILKRMKCFKCNNEFWETWEVDEDLFCDELNEDQYFLGVVEEFEHLPETGIIEDIASYGYTSTEPFFANVVRSKKGKFPIYRRLTPEIVDMFDLGPIESRFDILDIDLDDIHDHPFFYFPRHK